MKVSIIIPTYNRSHYIGTTLDSFCQLNFPSNDYEIIVVDNNSTDNTKDIIKKYIEHETTIKIQYIFERRQGNHYARNTAAKIALGEILYFTDDDMIADTQLLKEVMKVFEFDKNVALVTGKVLPKWEITPPPLVIKYLQNKYLSLMDLREEFMITKEIDLLYSCHYAIKREVFFETEGFNMEFFGKKVFGDGETGLNLKVKKAGYWFGYNAKSIIYHMIPASRMTQKYLNKRIGVSGPHAYAYTMYRENPSTYGLIRRSLFAPIRGFFHVAKLLVKSIYKFDFAYVQFALAWTIYYFNFIKFNYRLLTKPVLRKLALKKDWLSNDTEFDNINIADII